MLSKENSRDSQLLYSFWKLRNGPVFESSVDTNPGIKSDWTDILGLREWISNRCISKYLILEMDYWVIL